MTFFSSLFTSLKDNTVIITANKRLSVRIFDEYRKIEPPKKSITILSLDDCLTKVWNQCSDMDFDGPMLLNIHQEYILWESILNEFNKHSFLQDSSYTAYLARKTWKLVKDWDISLDELENYETSEVRHFLRWAYRFTEKCSKRGFINYSSLMEGLIERYDNGLLHVPSNIILVGFLEFTPLEKRFFDCLKNLGCIVDCYCGESQETCDVKYVACKDQESEIYTMARWAKNIIETCRKSFVICVVPNLNQIRHEVRRIFSEVLDTNFNISSGNALIEEPIIYTAFEVLRFKKRKLSVQDISYLLRSPFIFDYENDFSERALLASKIKNFNCDICGFSYLMPIIYETSLCESLIDRLTRIGSVSVHEKRLQSEWVEVFLEELRIVNWARSRELTAIEIQIVDRFHKLLEEFKSLDVFRKAVSYSRAVSFLRIMASRTIFQPKTPAKTSVQVLGLLETSGQPCTHTWIMGLDDRNFPANVKANQLLPRFMQNKYDMPHANANRELYFSKLVMNQILRDSGHVIFSYPINEGDQKLQESVLIKKFPKVDIMQISLSNFTNRALNMLGTEKVLDFENDEALPVECDEVIKGGSDIFKQQAACPFKAFAKYRLHAIPLFVDEEKSYPFERGVFVHTIMEIFWYNVKSQEKLLSLSDDELKDIVKFCIEESVSSRKKGCEKLKQIEKICLEKLIMSWLIQEKKREKPFEVVSLEESIKAVISGLKIEIRIDRIDKISDNEYELIDYKTGSGISIKSWFGDRPNEPQLPLYALVCNIPITAVSFAQIRVGEMKFKRLDFSSETLEEWKETIERLAYDFCSGDARVDPKKESQTCKNCEFKSLCRWGQV